MELRRCIPDQASRTARSASATYGDATMDERGRYRLFVERRIERDHHRPTLQIMAHHPAHPLGVDATAVHRQFLADEQDPPMGHRGIRKARSVPRPAPGARGYERGGPPPTALRPVGRPGRAPTPTPCPGRPPTSSAGVNDTAPARRWDDLATRSGSAGTRAAARSARWADSTNGTGTRQNSTSVPVGEPNQYRAGSIIGRGSWNQLPSHRFGGLTTRVYPANSEPVRVRDAVRAGGA